MMTPQETEAAIDSLVATRYPYEVENILTQIEDPRDRTVVVAAALARSCDLGRRQGVEMERDRIRRSLGL